MFGSKGGKIGNLLKTIFLVVGRVKEEVLKLEIAPDKKEEIALLLATAARDITLIRNIDERIAMVIEKELGE